MANGAPTPRRKAASPDGLSRATLEFCDWLIDGVTLAANHPEFDKQAAMIAKAKREVSKTLVAVGGTPVAEARKQEQG